MTIDILGTKYEIVCSSAEQDEKLKTMDGYCDWTAKRIVIDTDIDDCTESVEDVAKHFRRVATHEIIHAFFEESGMEEYSHDETLVCWLSAMVNRIVAEQEKVKTIFRR